MGVGSSKDGSTDESTGIPSSVQRVSPQRTQYEEPNRRNVVTEDTLQLDIDMDSVVPTVFKWDHGGRNVYITGTFNNWERQIPMHRSGNDFSYVHNLKRGKHAFKFIVDDEWRFAPDQPTVADIEGRINNFIDVSDFTPYGETLQIYICLMTYTQYSAQLATIISSKRAKVIFHRPWSSQLHRLC